jgi:uncharacterized protein (TIGR00255 family)
MIKSMTGYGRADGEVSGRRLVVEIKAVNHRFLNFFSRLPPDLQRFEQEIQALVKGSLQRGQVNVFASWDGGNEGRASIALNLEVAREAAQALRRAAEAAGISTDVTLDHLLAIPAFTAPAQGTPDPEEFWKGCAPVFEQALADLEGFRKREGADLSEDLQGRLAAIGQVVDAVEERRPQVIEDQRARLLRRAEELAKDLPFEVLAERVALEVALYADRSDVAEEVVRLRSHIDKFRELLASGGVIGRKLDFMVQEMNRETNTIGSKGSDAETSRLVVEIKAELEKIREQVQNIE